MATSYRRVSVLLPVPPYNENSAFILEKKPCKNKYVKILELINKVKKKKVVSALDYERSEPGFESRATGVRFYFHASKKEEKSAVPRQRHLQPLVTITPERGPAITTITHG